MSTTDDAGRVGVAPSLEFEERTFPYIHTHDDEDGVPLPPSAAEQGPDDAEVQENCRELLAALASLSHARAAREN